MAYKKGKPVQHLNVTIFEPFLLGKRGITINVKGTHKQKNSGTAVITIGGIKWIPFGKQKPTKIIKWSNLAEM